MRDIQQPESLNTGNVKKPPKKPTFMEIEDIRSVNDEVHFGKIDQIVPKSDE